jgi:hypothetical protein
VTETTVTVPPSEASGSSVPFSATIPTTNISSRILLWLGNGLPASWGLSCSQSVPSQSSVSAEPS